MFELFDPGDDFVISRGANLPHWFQPGVTYFITFRTVDSLPATIADQWHAQREDWLRRHGVNPAASNYHELFALLPASIRREYHIKFSGEYLANLDKGWGACVLKRPELSRIVANALQHFDGQRYHLGDFVVMPNHVHVMACLLGATRIEDLTYSWKKFTATQINRVIKTKGRFWQEESFDHLIRSPGQFAAIRRYIAKNPSLLSEGEFLYYRCAI